MHLYGWFCGRSMLPHPISQFSVLNNSKQLAKYKQKKHPKLGLIVDLSKKLPSLELPECTSLLINWLNCNPLQDEMERRMDEIKKVFKSYKYPKKVKKLVLSNFVYSPEMMEYLTTTFDELESIKIVSFNPNSSIDPYEVSLPKFTTFSELEIQVSTSDTFDIDLPDKLKEFTINTCKMNLEKNSHTSQTIHASHCMLKSLIINKADEDISTLFIERPLIPSLEILISNTKNGQSAFYGTAADWYSNLRIFHFSRNDICRNDICRRDDEFPFIIKSSDGTLSLDEKMCPNIMELGMFDEFGEIQIIWKKQK